MCLYFWQIFKEYGCGWGLKTLEYVKKGQLVFEYVGEVIDDDELTVSPPLSITHAYLSDNVISRCLAYLHLLPLFSST